MVDLREKKKAITIGVLTLLAAAVFSSISDELNSWMEDVDQVIGRRDLSISQGNVKRRPNARKGSTGQRQRKNALDPKTVVIKPFDNLSSLRRKSWKDATILDDGTYLLFQDEFRKGTYCETIINNKNRIKRLHYHAGSCKLFDGQFGNRLGTVYGMKMVANALHVPFHFTCEMNEGETANGAAFLMNLNSHSDALGPPPKNKNGEELTVEDVCQACGEKFCTWHSSSLALAGDAMISDWNNLADSSLVKISDHDDAVIHLRLGDALFAAYGRNEFKGVFPHATYIKLLKQAQKEMGTITSIGLLTAPFSGSFVRSSYDTHATLKSKTIAMDLLDAIQRAFPHAKVTLHNRPEETIVESLARIVHARKVAICGCSTFCPYPLLATKGIGFMYNQTTGQNLWVKNAAEQYKHFRLFDTPLLNGLVMENRKTGETLDLGVVAKWMRNQNPDIGNVDITGPPIFLDLK
ncbi:hypothetical protein HJC23_011787 [Cyclotella cryptica]|uniref:Uncharacterized protein n=1 Tax=Cyclotella cryptica TaxID=29204 RepID=A0ABD3PIW6_9STRA